jgi:ubiquinone/menaquinone biosynthesis C-methylase UbiE
MAAYEDTMWWYRALHERLIALVGRLELAAGGRVLDAGCGTGGLLRRLAEEQPTLEYVGLEYDPTAAEIAREKSGVQVRVGSVNAMPFPDEDFQAVVSADVLCHESVDEDAALAELHRCLAGGGSLLLNLPAYEWMKSSHDERVHTARRYTKMRARRAIERAGFRTAAAGYWNSLLLPVMLVHRLTSRHGGASDVRAFPGWQERLFYGTTALERRLTRLGLRLPFGGSVWIWAVKP